MKAIRIARVEQKDWKEEINKFLIAYRSTPQATTGATPFYLMFGREMRTKLQELRREQTVIDESVRDADFRKKIQGKEYSDGKRRSMPSAIIVGDTVLLKTPKVDKFSTNFHPTPCKVVKREGGEVTVETEDGKEVKPNVSFMRKFHDSKCDDQTVVSESSTSSKMVESEVETKIENETAVPTP